MLCASGQVSRTNDSDGCAAARSAYRPRLISPVAPSAPRCPPVVRRPVHRGRPSPRAGTVSLDGDRDEAQPGSTRRSSTRRSGIRSASDLPGQRPCPTPHQSPGGTVRQQFDVRRAATKAAGVEHPARAAVDATAATPDLRPPVAAQAGPGHGDRWRRRTSAMTEDTAERFCLSDRMSPSSTSSVSAPTYTPGAYACVSPAASPASRRSRSRRRCGRRCSRGRCRTRSPRGPR